MADTVTDTTATATTEAPPVANEASAAATETAAALFQQALAGGNGEAAKPDATQEQAPAADPAAVAATPAPVAKPKPKSTGNVFAQARQAAKGLAEERARLQQEHAALAAERQRLQAAAGQQQVSAKQAAHIAELANLLESAPDKFVSRLAQLTGDTEQNIIKRINVRATVGPEVDETTQALNKLKQEHEIVLQKLEQVDKDAKARDQQAAEQAFMREYYASIEMLVDITAGARDNATPEEKKDAEMWPNIAISPPSRVSRDVQVLINDAYRDVPGFKPTKANLRLIANALDKRYADEHRVLGVDATRRAGSVTPKLSATQASTKLSAGTGSPTKPVTATAANGSRGEVAAAVTSGSRALSDDEREALARQMFRKALFGDG